MEHKQIKKSHQDKETNKSSSDEEILCENLEKTKQLMSYTNKQQHPKESYKTGINVCFDLDPISV